ncbi:MAG TPA: peptidoglycan editing factor PgeF [Thermodesulfobacteriota bacterium]|nr:peptidoglycan editing factor PgeF [Thermodesulfobacteriota bacterium]
MCWLKSERLSKIGGVVHGFLDKRFNGNVPEVTRLTGLDRIATLRQVHSSDVLVIKNGFDVDSEREGDAIVTDRKGIGVGVFTADCVPLIFVDKSASCVAVAHAGWRGTLSQIAKATLLEMNSSFGVKPEEVRAVIGPSIGKCCYEVGEDVASLFVNRFGDSDRYVFRKTDSKYILDLKEANRASLFEEGVRDINIINICTKCNAAFNSYRREGKGVVSQLSFIGLV